MRPGWGKIANFAQKKMSVIAFATALCYTHAMKTSNRIGFVACAALPSLVAGAIEFAVPQNVPPLFKPANTTSRRPTRRPTWTSPTATAGAGDLTFS